jgi:hypothetical protein
LFPPTVVVERTGKWFKFKTAFVKAINKGWGELRYVEGEYDGLAIDQA